MKIKFILDYKDYRKGDTVSVSQDVGYGLIDKGVAIAHKQITSSRTK